MAPSGTEVMKIFSGQKPDDGWSNLDVAVWTVVVVFFTLVVSMFVVPFVF